MFKRVILESWHDYVPYVCFALIAGAFAAIVIRALLMKKSEVERIARLPLDEDPESQAEDEQDKTQ
ncbi:MAG: hypothetical protein WD342_08000 [Verrucomicrobiales bacterium]